MSVGQFKHSYRAEEAEEQLQDADWPRAAFSHMSDVTGYFVVKCIIWVNSSFLVNGSSCAYAALGSFISLETVKWCTVLLMSTRSMLMGKMCTCQSKKLTEVKKNNSRNFTWRNYLLVWKLALNVLSIWCKLFAQKKLVCKGLPSALTGSSVLCTVLKHSTFLFDEMYFAH